MLSKVLVPLDGSLLSEEALPAAARLARAAEGSLILMHAVTPSEYFSVTAAQYVQQERRRSAVYLQKLAEHTGNGSLGVQERIVTGEASREIVAEAKRSHADLIAMSSHGRSGIREWPFGSVAERVLRSTSVPVLVFRGSPGKSYTIRKILIALDGSEEALQVVGPAVDIATAFQATIVLAHVGKREPAGMKVARKLLLEHKVPFEGRLLSGPPAETLLGLLDEEKADLLALTTTGKTKSDQLCFGRVAEEILKCCGRPILVVHTGRTD
jgi:nucleotide-binding universal stress UspA family protein